MLEMQKVLTQNAVIANHGMNYNAPFFWDVNYTRRHHVSHVLDFPNVGFCCCMPTPRVLKCSPTIVAVLPRAAPPVQKSHLAKMSFCQSNAVKKRCLEVQVQRNDIAMRCASMVQAGK